MLDFSLVFSSLLTFSNHAKNHLTNLSIGDRLKIRSIMNRQILEVHLWMN